MKIKWVSSEGSYATEFLFYTESGYLGFKERAVVEKIDKGEAIMVTVPTGAIIPGPTLRLHQIEAQEFIQSFLDEAWDKGFRPKRKANKGTG